MHKITTISTALLLPLLLLGCSPDEPEPEPSKAAPDAVAERWNRLSGEERGAVCVQAREEQADVEGMLYVLMGAGIEQSDAKEMLAYAVNECVRTGS